jgi:hypothetical protein
MLDVSGVSVFLSVKVPPSAAETLASDGQADAVIAPPDDDAEVAVEPVVAVEAAADDAPVVPVDADDELPPHALRATIAPTITTPVATTYFGVTKPPSRAGIEWVGTRHRNGEWSVDIRWGSRCRTIDRDATRNHGCSQTPGAWHPEARHRQTLVADGRGRSSRRLCDGASCYEQRPRGAASTPITTMTTARSASTAPPLHGQP